MPNLDRPPAASNLTIAQGGLTACIELAAVATTILYFPLMNHLEQIFHVAIYTSNTSLSFA
jgi:hypothetical protein